MDLNAGKYSLVLGIGAIDSKTILARLQGVGAFRVVSDLIAWGRIVRDTEICVEQPERQLTSRNA